MGQILSRHEGALELGTRHSDDENEGQPSRRLPRAQKRKRGGRRNRNRTANEGTDNDDDDDVEEDESEKEFDDLLHTPKRRRLQTTSRYIYEKLFVEGKQSDLTLRALNREWKLHKLYLCQSPYFASMFSGSWRESTMNVIPVTIVDTNITLDAMHIALGSLYQDEITVEPADVIPILATATLFQLEGLMEQCYSIMEETINVQTVVKYYDMSALYGAGRVRQSCLQWLKVNLLHHLPEQPDRLRELSTSLMLSLVGSPDLCVMQTEFSVYVLLRLWLFLIFHPAWHGNPQDAVMESHKFFQERVKRERTFFLETPEGQPYVDVFRKLRFTHLVNHHMDMDMLLSDRIIPRSWMYPVYQSQWQLLLRIDQGIDKGPQSMTEDEFNQSCLRCGRTLNTAGQQHMWRWTGFNMGVDLIVTFDNWNLSMKRSLGSTGTHEHEALLSNHKKRHISYRVSVFSLNEQKQIIYKETSGIQSVSLGRNSSHPLLRVDPTKATFPLLLSFNFAVTTPLAPDNGIDPIVGSQGDIDVENVPA